VLWKVASIRGMSILILVWPDRRRLLGVDNRCVSILDSVRTVQGSGLPSHLSLGNSRNIVGRVPLVLWV
jgi:hypothetical protein